MRIIKDVFKYAIGAILSVSLSATELVYAGPPGGGDGEVRVVFKGTKRVLLDGEEEISLDGMPNSLCIVEASGRGYAIEGSEAARLAERREEACVVELKGVSYLVRRDLRGWQDGATGVRFVVVGIEETRSTVDGYNVVVVNAKRGSATVVRLYDKYYLVKGKNVVLLDKHLEDDAEKACAAAIGDERYVVVGSEVFCPEKEEDGMSMFGVEDRVFYIKGKILVEAVVCDKKLYRVFVGKVGLPF